jgi:hypothetical protein
MSTDYVVIAKQAGVPRYPKPTNSYETQLINLQKSQVTFDVSWGEAKRLYDEFLVKEDNLGLSTACDRLALLTTKAQQERWQVDGKLV